jgi:hypothetical protein
MERFRDQRATPGRAWGRFLFRIAGVIAFLIAGTARPATPQAIQGRLISQTTGGPVDAAIVSIFLGQERIARTLSDRDGGFTLDMPGSGTYRIVAERIGFATDTFAVIEVGADATTEFEFVLKERAIALDGIDVAATRRCETAAGEGVSRLWDEIRKALDAASLTSEGEYYQYGVIRYERERNVRTFAVESEAMRGRTILSSSPFRSAPAERLARNGYAQEARDGTFDYFAPDADVLLSATFLETHCFSIRESASRPDQIGLAFEPIRRSGPTDIEGVLWTDRASAELRQLEFRYVRLPHGVRDARLGGSATFERQSSGGWIVRDWAIRMPLLGRGPVLRHGEVEIVVGRILEMGGEIVELLPGDRAATIAAAARSRAARRAADSVAAGEAGSRGVRTERSAGDTAFVLPGVDVTAASRRPDLDRAGFYDRQRISTGRFYTREQIEQRMALRPSHVLQGIPGLRFAATHGTGQAIWFRMFEKRGQDGRVIPCGPRLFVDGVLVHTGGLDNPLLIDEFINVNDIAGIEVYRGAVEVPPQYSGAESMCGVLVIWRRHS